MRKITFMFLAALIVLIACKQKSAESQQAAQAELSDSAKIENLTKLIEKNPRNAEYYADRSKLHAAQGKLTNAVKDLLMANRLDSLNPDYYLVLADFYLGMGKSESVSSILTKGNKLVPNNRDILYRLGNLYFYIQDYSKAMDYLNQAQEIDNYFAEIYFTKGLVFNELGRKEKAIETFQFALEREPEYYDAYIQLGLLFSEKKDSLALDYFDNALRLVPDSYEAYYGKAIFYQQAEQPGKAIELYNTMLDNLGRNLPAVHFNLGYIEMIYYGEFKTAIQYFDSALMNQPEYFQAYNNIGFCYEQLGDKNKARENYKKVLEYNPKYELAIQGLSRLK